MVPYLVSGQAAAGDLVVAVLLAFICAHSIRASNALWEVDSTVAVRSLSTSAPAPQEEEEEAPGEPARTTGLQAALHFQKQALHALFEPVLGPLRQRTRGRFSATHVYLVVCIVLYGFVSSAFLLPDQARHIPSNMPLLGTPFAHMAWGTATLTVALAQVAAIVRREEWVWTACAVWTAVVAGALEVLAVSDMLLRTHQLLGPAFWLFVLVMHVLFVNYELVPRARARELNLAHPLALHESEAAEGLRLKEQAEQLLDEVDGRPRVNVPPSPSPARSRPRTSRAAAGTPPGGRQPRSARPAQKR